MNMWLKPNHHARPGVIQIVVHQIVDHRGRRKFLTTMAGRAISVSQNPILCSAEALLEEGHDPATQFCSWMPRPTTKNS